LLFVTFTARAADFDAYYVQVPPKMLLEREAEDCVAAGAGSFLVDDVTAHAGKAVRLGATGSRFSVPLGDLAVGCYVWYVIARVENEDTYVGNERKPLYLTFTVTGAQLPKYQITNRVTFALQYQDIARFHIYVDRPARGVTVTVAAGDRSQVSCLVDRFQLRDALDGCAAKRLKRGRTCLSNEAIAARRTAGGTPVASLPASENATARDALDNVIWSNMMPVNATPSDRNLYYGIHMDHAKEVKSILTKNISERCNIRIRIRCSYPV